MVELSAEMARYAKSGKCPYCRVRILDSPPGIETARRACGLDPDVNKEYLQFAAMRQMAPSGSRVAVDADGTALKCLSCTRSWRFIPIILWRSRTALGQAGHEVRLLSPVGPPALTPGGAVNLADCRAISFEREVPKEVPLHDETRLYPNDSAVATLTKEIEITHSVSRSVTVDDSRITSRSGDASVTFFGFAAIRGQVLQQISARYALNIQVNLTFSERTSITVPPRARIRHVVRWKIVHDAGTVVLGRQLPGNAPQPVAAVPYLVPQRLTYTEEIVDEPR